MRLARCDGHDRPGAARQQRLQPGGMAARAREQVDVAEDHTGVVAAVVGSEGAARNRNSAEPVGRAGVVQWHLDDVDGVAQGNATLDAALEPLL